MNPHDGPESGDFRPGEEFDPDMITMNPPRRRRWRPGRPIAVAGVAVVALAGGAGAGYAATHSLTAKAADTAAVSSAPTSSPSASPSPPAGTPGSGTRHGWRWFPIGPGKLGLGGLGGLGGGLLHGEFTVPKSGGGYQTLDVQDGTVTAVSAGSVTVKSTDGYTKTYTVTSNTVVDARAAGIGSVKKGDTVFVTATVSGSTPTAASIFDLTAIKAGRASFGFPERPAMPSARPQAPSA